MKVTTATLASLSLIMTQSLECLAFTPLSVSPRHSITSQTSSLKRHMTSSSPSTEEGEKSSSPFDFLSGLFQPSKGSEAEVVKPKIPDVVIDSDFTLSYVFGGIGLIIFLTGGFVPGGLNLLFASFLAVQAKRIRFVFDETAFELKNVDLGASDDDVLKESGENFVVGGANRWDYDAFVNYDFFPSADLPILVYFKETQTPSELWEEGPGQLDKVGGGQVHFFPAIANVKQLQEQFELRGCAKKANEE